MDPGFSAQWLMVIGGLAVIAALSAQIARGLRRSDRRLRRQRRRNRHIAHRRTWDWLMGRTRQRRLTYRVDDEKAK